MKRVYLITNSTESIDEQMQNLNLKGDYTIVLMFLNPPSNYWTRILSNTTPIKDGTITYYKINHNSIK